MVTSAFPGEGKTFVAANLAVSLAMGIGEYVLLVDCDFRRPDLHSMFGYSNTEGFYEYLAGKRQLHDVLIKTKVEKLSLLTAGSPLPNHSELLSSIRMKEFLKKVEARNQDHFIIIDTAPSQVTADAGVLANYVDAIIFVVMAQRSPREAIKRSIENLGKKKILGIVFNGCSESYKAYHKYYRRYYEQQIP
jgi:capsular exopolysaccharide synthesis family protein